MTGQIAPFCRVHRYTMIESVACDWYMCPIGGEAVTHEQLDRGDQTPHDWWPAGWYANRPGPKYRPAERPL